MLSAFPVKIVKNHAVCVCHHFLTMTSVRVSASFNEFHANRKHDQSKFFCTRYLLTRVSYVGRFLFFIVYV
jgi:hypothetical protein